MCVFRSKHDTVSEGGASLSQSEFTSATIRAWLSQWTAHIQVNDNAEKMGMIPALLVFIFQVGNPSLVVEGRPVIIFVQMRW